MAVIQNGENETSGGRAVELSEIALPGHKSLAARLIKYTGQPERLPESLLLSLRQSFGEKGLNVRLFAYIDLDARYKLSEGWLILLSQKIVYAYWEDEKWSMKVAKLSILGRVYEAQALSCNRLFVLGKQDSVLLSVRYSHRQARSVGLIKFILEEEIKRLSMSVKPDEESYQGVSLSSGSAEQIYQRETLFAVSEAQSSVAGGQMAVVWRLLGCLKPYRWQVLAGMGAAILMTAVSLVPAYLTGYMIDHVIKPFELGSMTKAQALHLTWVTIAGLTCIYLLREFFGWIRLRKMSVLGEYVARDLRNQVYAHLHKLSLSFFSSKQTGSLISRVGSDTDRIWDFIAFGVVEVTTSIMMLLGLAIVLMHLDWQLGLLVTLPVPLVLWIIYRHGQHMEGLFLRAWRKWSHLTDCLSDTIPGIRVVKAFHRHTDETKKFQSRNSDVVGEFNRIHGAWTTFWPALMLVIHTIVLAVWFFGVPRVIGTLALDQISTPLTAGVFVSFVLYLTMFTQPIEIIGQMARMVNRATSSAHRVFEVLDTEPQIVEVMNPVKIDHLQGNVEFCNVSFSYDGIRKVIKNMSFKVNSGEMIGLVGPSGGGKTTVTHLMARFYEADSGQILIDGVNICSLDMAMYRKQLGMVLQDPYLFHGTVLENIRYAKPEADLDEVVEAARAANAHDFICRLTHGYDTIVGERGQSLSGGERQRVSIARAILRNPRILILDEATSAVDTETERKIQEALDRLVSGRTVFAIAHRLSTLASADRILVIKEGEIRELGHHKELMQTPNGIYRNLVNMQSELARV